MADNQLFMLLFHVEQKVFLVLQYVGASVIIHSIKDKVSL